MLIVLAAAATVTWGTFCVWYGVRAHWAASPVGRNTMATSVLLAAAFARVTALTIWPAWSGDVAVTAAVLCLAGAAMGAHRIALLERAQRDSESVPG